MSHIVIYLHARTHVYMHARMHMWSHPGTHTHWHTHMHTHIQTHTHACVHTHTHTHTHTHIYVCAAPLSIPLVFTMGFSWYAAICTVKSSVLRFHFAEWDPKVNCVVLTALCRRELHVWSTLAQSVSRMENVSWRRPYLAFWNHRLWPSAMCSCRTVGAVCMQCRHSATSCPTSACLRLILTSAR